MDTAFFSPDIAYNQQINIYYSIGEPGHLLVMPYFYFSSRASEICDPGTTLTYTSNLNGAPTSVGFQVGANGNPLSLTYYATTNS